MKKFIWAAVSCGILAGCATRADSITAYHGRITRSFRVCLMRYAGLLDLFPVLVVLSIFAAKFKYMRSASTDSFFLAVSQHDAIILGVILFLLAVSKFSVGLGAVLRLMVLFGVLLYGLDALAYYFFGTRLYISDVITFSSELDSFGTMLRTGARTVASRGIFILGIGSLFLLGALLLSCLFIALPRRTNRGGAWLFGTGLLFTCFYAIPLPVWAYSFGDKPLYENLVERNASFFRQTGYSDGYRNHLVQTPVEKTCRRGAAKKSNVIVVIVESLSSYHSKYFSGVENWTPRLDAIAKRETALTNFYANGWTTIGGLISLLTGTFPFVPEQAESNEWGSPRLDNFAHLSDTLPRNLADEGYKTIFVGAGDLAFLGQDKWLRRIGFQQIIGHDDPRFDTQKVRGPFNSVPDGMLYRVVMEEIRKVEPGQPYFVTAQTYWSHRPFMAPDGSDEHSEEHVIRLTDRMLGELYESLEATNFFDDGVLFVTGDHRAMEPFRREEIDRFGPTAPARIPAIVATRVVDLQQAISNDYQQRDLKASIEAIVASNFCLDSHEGAWMGPAPKVPGCIMHARGDDRDLVLVKCGEDLATVKIAGDNTGVVNGKLADEAAVIHAINSNRVRKVRHPGSLGEDLPTAQRMQGD